MTYVQKIDSEIKLDGGRSKGTLWCCEHEKLIKMFKNAMSESCDTIFAGQGVYIPWILSVSSEALMPITAILIPATNCVLLLHGSLGWRAGSLPIKSSRPAKFTQNFLKIFFYFFSVCIRSNFEKIYQKF